MFNIRTHHINVRYYKSLLKFNSVVEVSTFKSALLMELESVMQCASQLNPNELLTYGMLK